MQRRITSPVAYIIYISLIVLSKLDYNDVVCSPVPDYLLKRLQRMQLAVAGFVLRKYASISDIPSLGWLPVVERRDYIKYCNKNGGCHGVF